MDRQLLDKYFNDQCSPRELEQVLDWFQTNDGHRFLEEDFKQEWQQSDKISKQILAPGIEGEKIFRRIQQDKNKEIKLRPALSRIQDRWYIARVASLLLIVAALSFGLYLGGWLNSPKEKPTPAFTTYITAAGQQKVFSLSNGVKIWLNENSVLTVPTSFTRYRHVALKGEAYFEVTHNASHPFVVNANGAIIKDLGTRFVVMADSAADDVQVAVIEGKVKLKKKGERFQTSAILTHNHFGMLDLSDGQITIEKGNVRNYLSWMTNQLVFNGEPLGTISRQLERLYHVKISFQSSQLKKVRLTANFEKTKLKTVLKLIAHTLDIRYRINGKEVVWMK